MRISKPIARLRLRGAIVSTALVAASALSFLAASPASAAPGGWWIDTNAGYVSGCDEGYACVWDEMLVVDGSTPEHRYYYYGTYNFVGEYGGHTIWNRQTGGARVLLCLGYNGTNCVLEIPANTIGHGDLTPYNSIVIAPLY